MKKIFFSLFAGAVMLTSCNAKAGTVDNDLISDEASLTTEKNKKDMGTIKMTKIEFLTKIHNYEKDMENWEYLGDKPAIIDFYADWCGPCKQIAPVLEELAKEYKDQIYIYKIDVDSEQELASLFNVRSIPTMLFIPMEGQPSMAAGVAPKEELKKAIESVLLNKK